MNKNFLLIPLTIALSLPWVGCKKSTVVKTTTSMPTGPVDLQIKWPEGRHMVQNFDLKQNNEMNIPGMNAPMKQDMALGQKYGMTVLKDRGDGKHEVELEFLSTRMTMKMGEKVMLDSDSSKKSSGAAPDPAADVFGKVVGAKIRYLLDASNRVEKVEGIEDLQNRLTAAAGSDPTGALKSMFTEDSLKQMMDHGRNLPGKPVSPGDSWPVQLEIAMGALGTLVMDYTYTLQNWEKRHDRYCARIGIEGTVKSKPGEAPNGQGMNIAIDGGTSSGETWFDLDLGMFVDTTMNQDMKMTITMPNPMPGKAPNAPKTQTITGSLTQTIGIKLESVR